MTRPAAHLARRGMRYLREEGTRSALARLLDHLADRRREASFRPPVAAALRNRIEPPPVLNLLGFPPRRSRGGVALQLLDRLEIEAGHRTTALLFPLDGRARLEIQTRDAKWALDCGPAWSAPAPASATALLAAVAEAQGITATPALHVESVIGLPAAPLVTLARRQPLILSVHDFGLFCERPHLIEAGSGRFCEYSRDFARCRHCLASGQAGADDPGARRSLMGELLARAVAALFASPFMARAHLDLFPDATTRPLLVVPAIRLQRQAARAGAEGRPIAHVAFAGALNDAKGAGVLDLLFERRAEFPQVRRWSVYGGGDSPWRRRLERHSGVRFHGWYRARTLPALLAREQVDLLLLPSRMPEAHCLVLDEAWSAGVPVLASAAGALGDRVREVGGGWVADPSELPLALGGLLRAPDAAMAAVRERLARWQPRTPEDAAAEVLSLYATIGAASWALS